VIRSYDFRPAPDRADCYVEGEVVEVDHDYHGARCYLIKVTREGWLEGQGDQPGRRGAEIAVPYEVSFNEYHGRLSLI
jgi:hypothetical protein